MHDSLASNVHRGHARERHRRRRPKGQGGTGRDLLNVKHAQEHANCTKAETVALHKKNAAAAATIVRGLDDAQLDRTGTVLAGMPAMSAAQFVERALIGHIDEHIGSIRDTVGG